MYMLSPPAGSVCYVCDMKVCFLLHWCPISGRSTWTIYHNPECLLGLLRSNVNVCMFSWLLWASVCGFPADFIS